MSPPPDDRDALVTVATFDAPVSAEIAKAFLEDHGVRAFVQDAHTVSITQAAWLTGGVRLQVPAGEAERAKALIADLEAEGAAADFEAEGFEADLEAESGRRPERGHHADADRGAEPAYAPMAGDPAWEAGAAPSNPIAALGAVLAAAGIFVPGGAGLVLAAMGAVFGGVGLARAGERRGRGRVPGILAFLLAAAAVARYLLAGGA